MDNKKFTNKHSLSISKRSVDDTDVVMKTGYQDMLAGRIVPAKKAFLDIRKNYGLEGHHAKEKR